MNVLVVAGARPNFMKIAPVIDALKTAQGRGKNVHFKLVHTGQHYDDKMSRAFFNDLGLPRPDIDLEVGSGTHAEQTAKVLIAFERLLIEEPPEWVVVVGDVNSTMACTLAAKKLCIRVAHVEAGLRSRDWTMPEEINRVVTDVLCDLLFTTDVLAGENLQREGIDPAKIRFVGNVMIDTLLHHRERAVQLQQWRRLGLEPNSYAVITLHRPGNVDEASVLRGIVRALQEIGKKLQLVFPVHPRTRKMAEAFGVWEYLVESPAIHLLEPLGYLEMLSLNSHARMILTDSGGLQEEAVVLGIPCITLRENTERPITIEVGANQLVGAEPEAIIDAVNRVLADGRPELRLPEKWDGRAAERIVEILLSQN